jgi:hypothetical protein
MFGLIDKVNGCEIQGLMVMLHADLTRVGMAFSQLEEAFHRQVGLQK